MQLAGLRLKEQLARLTTITDLAELEEAWQYMHRTGSPLLSMAHKVYLQQKMRLGAASEPEAILARMIEEEAAKGAALPPVKGEFDMRPEKLLEAILGKLPVETLERLYLEAKARN